MATEEQCERIAFLLEEMDLGRQDLSFEHEQWAVYERVSEEEADDIIAWLRNQTEVLR